MGCCRRNSTQPHCDGVHKPQRNLLSVAVNVEIDLGIRPLNVDARCSRYSRRDAG